MARLSHRVEQYYTVADIAERLALSRATVIRLIRERHITRAVQLRRGSSSSRGRVEYRVPGSAVAAFLRGQEVH
jgi:excisionase family DNA binding protein